MNIKILSLLFLAALVFAAEPLHAATQTVNGIEWTYIVSNGEALVGGGSSTSPAVPTSTTGAITIPSTLGGYPVTRIRNYGFCGCSGLTSISIPDSVTIIAGNSAFYGCSGLVSFDVDINNPSFSSQNGLLLSKDCGTLVAGVNGDVTIPNSVTNIGRNAFYVYSGLTSVTIPNSVTTIGEGAFSGCSGLTSVAIPDSVTSVGNYAFYGCSGLVSFDVDINNPSYSSQNGLLLSKDGGTLVAGVNGDVTIPNSVTNIGDNAFYGYSGLISVTIPNSVTSIGSSAFQSCSGLKSVTIPNSVTSIGSSAFQSSGLTSVTISDSVTSIGANAFSGCSGLTSVTIPDSVTSIGANAFFGCSGLTSVTIPDSVTTIGQSAFSGCSGLTSVTIPNSVTNIGDNAFKNASSLETVVVPGSFRLSTVFPAAYSSITNAVISQGSTNIAANAFYGCSGLISVTIPDSVTSIVGSVFRGCSGLISFDVDINNPSYSSQNGLLLSKDGGTLVAGVNGDVTIPNSVTNIGDYAFYGYSGLISVTIPDSVTTIGQSAFSGCSGLTSVTIPASVTSVPFSAFYDCSRIRNVTIPGSFRLSRVFPSAASSISNAVISQGSTNIAANAFSGCSGLTSVTIPDGVTSIGDYAFKNCSGLMSVSIPDSVTTIENDAFSGCSGLTMLVVPGSLRQQSSNWVLPSACTVVFRTPPVLDVATAHGTASPSGRTTWSWGDEVAARVAADEPVNGVRYVCTGWTGTGSVPATGAGTNVTFTIEEDSTLTWNWRKENRIAVTVSGSGSCSFGTQWIADGTAVTAQIVPSTHLYTIALSGDTTGVTLAGTTLTIPGDGPHAVTVTVTEVKLALDVASAHGTPTPAAGRTAWSWGDTVAASVAADEPADGVRYVCTGWTGTGGVPAAGAGTNVTFTIEEDSTLTWNWRKENRIAVTVAGPGTCSFGTQWIADGTAVTAQIVPSTHLYEIALSGDTNGVTLAGTTLTIPGDGPHAVTVTVTEVKLALDVATAHGTATPAAGRTEWSWGAEVAASVPGTVEDGRSRYICTGWTGTGSVPASGTAASTTFMIEVDSSIAWSWRTERQISVLVSGLGSCSFGTQWIEDGTTVTAQIVPSTHLYDISVFDDSGDAGGVSLDGTTLTIRADRPRMVMVQVAERKVALAVATAHGTASPSGRTEWSWGDSVAASVAADAPADGVRYVCTGWTGTGSVPASGTATNATFTIEEDSTLTWNWQQENQIAVTVSGVGTCSFGTQWIPDGSTATAAIVPTTHLYEIALSGDTNGVTLTGTTLTIPSDGPRDIAVTVTEVKLALDVATAHGTATPAAGRTAWSWGDTVAASVAADEPADGVRYVCAGWTGTGSVPASGTATNASFTIEENSTLTWNWEKQNRITVTATGVGTCAFGTQWVADGTNATATIVPTTHLYEIALSGDTNGVTLAGTTLTIPSDGPREIAVTVTEVKLALDVATAHGTPTPTAGRTEWSWGDEVAASVPGTVEDEGTRHLCTGWTGKGSVPASGTAASATFTIEEDSTLTWNWRTERRISVLVSGPGSCSFGTQWIPDGSTAMATIVPSVHLYDISVYDDSGDEGGVSLDGTTLTIRADRPRMVMVQVSERKLALDVAAAHGTATPAAGRTTWSWNDTVAASVAADAPADGVRYVCTGWTGTGSVPASGTATNVTFTIEEDSTLAWNWRKDNRIAVTATGVGTCAFGTQWVADGTNATASIVPTTHLYEIALSGDTNGVTLAGTTLTIPSDGPRDIAVTVTEVKLALDVATEHGTPTPAAGRTDWSWGDTVAASVAADEPVDGVRYVCTGWTGTGSVPANGTGASASFAIEEDSTLAWSWEKQNQITVMAAGEGTCDFGTRWIADGTTTTAQIVPTVPLYRIRLFGDAEGVELDGTVVTIPSDRPRMIGVTVDAVSLKLDVASAYGTPTPAAGRTGWTWGDTIRASVAAPEPTGGVRRVCTGWTGTGSVPASGTGTNVMFVIEEDSTLAWSWEEQVLASFAAVDDADPGSASTQTVWTARGGAPVAFAFAKPAGLFAWTLAGDTNGVVVDAAGGVVTVPADAPRSVRLTVHGFTVDEAVRTGEALAWGADGTWFVCEEGTASGGLCLRSGRIDAGETSAFEAEVAGPGRLSFSWKISSNRGHFAKFRLDGVETNSITRSTDWAELSFALGTGTHALRWTYEKGTGATAGEDAAFLDDVRWEPLSLAEALDATNLVWSTDGDAPWAPQIDVSADGVDAARSGAVSGQETSRLSTTVEGPGTLSWKWKAVVAGSAGVDVYLDGANLYDAGVYLEGASDWADSSLEIAGDGEHAIVFEFWNGGTAATVSDCAYLDCVSWTPAGPASVVVEGVEIPVAWLDENAPAAVAAAGGDYEAAARATAANGADKVWQCYVSGVSPSNAAERLLATIGFGENGEPVVTWTPDLNEGGTKSLRVYTVEGKAILGDGSWGPTNAATRFFRVKVEMP